MKSAQDFITSHTTLTVLDYLPQIRLHLASEMEPLWKDTEIFLDDTEAEPPFWAFAWAGGLGLSRFILDNPHVVADKNVLDFASGSGLVGIAAYLAGASNVYCCEIDPIAQEAIRMNASANDVTLKEMTITNPKFKPKGIDIILAGDVFYDHLMAYRVLGWLRHCAERGITVLLGDPGRAYKPKEGVVTLETYRVPTSLALEDVTERVVEVFKLKPDLFEE